MGAKDTAEATPVRTAARRRASRAAGPATEELGPAAKAVTVERPVETRVRLAKPAGPPPRRQPNRTLVTAIGLGVVAVMAAALVGVVVKMGIDHRRADASNSREQRFVDTANQMIMNMYSWTQDSLDKNIDQFVSNTSGPLRDKFTERSNTEGNNTEGNNTEGNNTDTLKAILRKTGNSSEAVINAAALESVDEISRNAAVLVAFRVTTTDMQGTVAPTQQQRVRIIVHEDDNGHMTDYDLKWPEGGT